MSNETQTPTPRTDYLLWESREYPYAMETLMDDLTKLARQLAHPNPPKPMKPTLITTIP